MKYIHSGNNSLKMGNCVVITYYKLRSMSIGSNPNFLCSPDVVACKLSHFNIVYLWEYLIQHYGFTKQMGHTHIIVKDFLVSSSVAY